MDYSRSVSIHECIKFSHCMLSIRCTLTVSQNVSHRVDDGGEDAVGTLRVCGVPHSTSASQAPILVTVCALRITLGNIIFSHRPAPLNGCELEKFLSCQFSERNAASHELN